MQILQLAFKNIKFGDNILFLTIERNFVKQRENPSTSVRSAL